MAPKEPAEGYQGCCSASSAAHAPPAVHREAALARGRGARPAVAASAWWADVERRLAGGDVALEAAIEADTEIPSGLFDSFAENAIDNARQARASRRW